MSGSVASATYDAVITHVRRAPLTNRFRYRTTTWLVDLASLPVLPRGLRWLARFDARDHVGDPGSSIRDNVVRFLATEGIDVADGTVLMLAHPRSLGHAFNPLSVHWAYDAEDRLSAVVAEVHNTYGERHAYLLTPDAAPAGTAGDGAVAVDAVVAKAMYVSPFNPVHGSYRITVSDPGERVTLSVRLDREGEPPFVATLRARRRAARSPLAAGLATAGTSLRVAALIRWQGVRLVLRGLRVEPRPVHPPMQGAL